MYGGAVDWGPTRPPRTINSHTGDDRDIVLDNGSNRICDIRGPTSPRGNVSFPTSELPLLPRNSI
jgi:hypothetical protein